MTQSVDVKDNKSKRGTTLEINDIVANLSRQTEYQVAKFIFDYTIANPTGFSCPDFTTFLNENTDLKVNENEARKILKYYNCTYDNESKYYGFTTHERISDLERFLRIYSHALFLEEKNKAIIVYQDETWANTGTCMKASYMHECRNDPNCISSGICSYLIRLSGEDCAKACISRRDGGKRVAISWAHTKDGVLIGKNNDGSIAKCLDTCQQLNFDMSIPSSELIFECKKEGDYHTQFDSETYEAYVEKELYQHSKVFMATKKC